MADNIQRQSEPPGVMPRKAQYYIFAGITLLIVAMSMFSSRTGRKIPDSKLAATQAPVRAAQISEFEKLLERQHQELELRRRQEEEARRLQEQAGSQVQPSPHVEVQTQRTPAEEAELQRSARAPFSPSVVYRAASEPSPSQEPNPSKISQVVSLEPGAEPSNAEKRVTAQGSGKFLPEREGLLFRLYEGTLIRTVLENSLEGSFTGPVKCKVTEPVFSKAKTTVLVPPGSEFFGEARRVEERNQERLAVWFKRLLLPNGYSLELENTPGLNDAGETGLKDKTNNHYIRRFSVAGAIGLLGGLRLYGGRPDPYGFESGLTSSIGTLSSNEFSRRTNDLPTITIRKGQEVDVYLSADLLVPEYRPGKGNL